MFSVVQLLVKYLFKAEAGIQIILANGEDLKVTTTQN